MNSSEINQRTTGMAVVNVINVLLGLWVAISPFVLGFSGNSAALWTNLIVGTGLAILAFIGGWKNSVMLVWMVPLASLLFISAFSLLQWGTWSLWNNVIMTFAVFLGAAISEGLRLGEPPKASATS